MAGTMGVPESLRQCMARPGFTERFLTLLAERAPHLRDRIAAAEGGAARLTAQRCMTTLVLAVSEVVSPAEFEARFRECTGAGGLGLGPETYPAWADALLTAVREADPGMDSGLLASWQAALLAGARLLGTRLPPFTRP